MDYLLCVDNIVLRGQDIKYSLKKVFQQADYNNSPGCKPGDCFFMFPIQINPFR